ncbi:g5968 [Coccomyxa viridis]|uniref:G5968 protein n=1 Tax=Coccomyxa viridis TaxID=1274662 RepID=A0ABP1FU82_9CHLO
MSAPGHRLCRGICRANLGSSGLPSPAQSRAATPEKLQAHVPVLDTPPGAMQDLATAAEDSSPPRLKRKATLRELAEQFRGHGRKQAKWAPIPIYWVKDRQPGYCT